MSEAVSVSGSIATASFLRDSAYSAVGQATGVVINFASSIILARWLGPEQQGIYALIVASVTLLTLVGDLGLQSAWVYLIGKRLYPARSIVGQALVLAVLITIAMGLAVGLPREAVITTLIHGLTPGMIWLIIVLTGSALLSSFLSAILLGLDRIRLLAGISIAVACLRFVLLFVFLILLRMGIGGAIWQLLLTYGVSVGLMSIVVARRVGVDPRPSWPIIGEALRYGLNLYPGYLGYSLLNRIDLYLVNYFSGATDAGVYSVAVGVAEKMWIIDQAISHAATPKIVAMNSQDAARLVAQAFRFAFWMLTLLAAVAAIFSRWLFPVVYGPKYSGSILPFILLMPGIVCLSSRVISPFFSMHLGRPKLTTLYTLGAGLVSLPIYYAATRSFGYIGAAAASSIVYSIYALIVIALFKHFSKYSYGDIFLPRKDDWRSLIGLARGILIQSGDGR